MAGEALRLQLEKRKLVLFDAAVATQRTSYMFDLMRTGEDSIRTCTTGFLVGFESGESVSFQCSSKDAMSIVMQVKQWWKGHILGSTERKGVFPRMYVKELAAPGGET